MPSNSPRPSKADRREAAREQARLMREAERKRAQRNKIVGISAGAVAIVAIIAVVIYLVGQSSKPSVAYAGSDATAILPADVSAPSTAGSNGGIPVGADGVAGEAAAEGDVVVAVYTDFMCPYCGEFESANEDVLASLRTAGGVTVEYHLLGFLDSMSSGTEFSTRAGNAAAVVADQDPENFTAFYSALFANQPAEGSKGLSNSELADIAKDAGVSQTAIDNFTTTAEGEDWLQFAPFLTANANQMNADFGSVGSPTVLINGEKFTGDLYTTGPLTEAIQAAMAG